MSNTTLNEIADPHTNHVLGFLTALLGIVTVIGNLITLLAIIKSQSRSMRRPHMILICCLSGLDLCIGLFHVVFVAIACFTGRWMDLHGDLVQDYFPKQIVNNNPWCKVSSFIVQPLFTMAISNVAVIGLERIITLRFPLKCNTWITNCRVIIFLFLTWIVVSGLLVLQISADHDTVYFMPAFQCMASYYYAYDVKLIILTSMTFNFISFLVIIIASLYTFFTLLKLRRKSHDEMGEAKDASQKKMILTLTILLLMCLDTSTWLPQYIAGTLRYFLPTSSRAFQTLTEYKLRTVVWWIQYLSPALNPVIYALRLKAVRNEIVLQFKLLVRMYPDNKRNAVHAVPMTGTRKATLESCWGEDSVAGRALAEGHVLTEMVNKTNL